MGGDAKEGWDKFLSNGNFNRCKKGPHVQHNSRNICPFILKMKRQHKRSISRQGLCVGTFAEDFHFPLHAIYPLFHFLLDQLFLLGCITIHSAKVSAICGCGRNSGPEYQPLHKGSFLILQHTNVVGFVWFRIVSNI